MKKIVSKGTSKSKRKGNVYKCDLCIRKFVSVSALKTHHRVQHNLQPYRTRAKQYANPTNNKEEKKDTAKVAPAVELTMSTRRASNVPNTTKVEFKAQKTQPANETPSSKVEFECPRCFLSFNTYLIAAQHIQKFHFADKKVPGNIQPERKELCLKCKRKVKSIPTHICGAERLEDQDVIYCCLGCTKRFSALRLFYAHVICVHSEGVESLFFPTNLDLAKWKQDMEYQTNGRYSQFVKVDSKYYAHCTQACGKSTKMMNVCPSLIMLQEFPKGIQIHYYSHHTQHPFKDYKYSSKFKKFSVTSFLKSSDSYYQLKDLKSDDNDLYLQFKQLMESVVLDAAKLKKETLTVLFGHALEMTSVLAAYDNDDDLSDSDNAKPVKRSMTITDIEKALEEPAILEDTSCNEPNKKKLRQESEAPSPMILNSFSLANTVDDATKENKIIEKVEKPNIKVKDIVTLQNPKILNDSKETTKAKTIDEDSTPSSFNESFEVFVEKNFLVSDNNNQLMKPKRTSRSNQYMKTKIGQYKPPSPQKLKVNTTKDKNNKKLLVEPLHRVPAIQESPKPAVPLQPTALPKGKSNIIETRQKPNSGIPEVVQKVKALTNVTIEVNKTTQTNNSTNKSPLVKSKDQIEDRPKPVSATSRTIKPKPNKVDIKYEVKEQKDDCNILILKI